MGVLDFFRRRAEPVAEPKPERERTSAVAMVALRRAELPDADRLVEKLRDGWPCDPRGTDAPAEHNVLMLNAPGGWAAVALMPVPIPWTELEWPAQAAAWRWPDAAASLQGHEAHLILHVGSGELDNMDTWVLLTRLAAAVVALTDAAGVYWGASSSVHEPESFVAQGASASRENLPMLIWVGFHPSRNENGTSVFTTGLDAFDLMDLEVRDSELEPSAVLERLLDLAVYCIMNGATLRDGDTVGASEAERIPVRHVPSAFLPGRMVCRITL